MKGNSLNPAMNRQLEPDTRRESPCVGGSSPVSDSEGLLGDRVSLEKKSGEEIKRQESGRVYSAPCCQEHKKGPGRRFAVAGPSYFRCSSFREEKDKTTRLEYSAILPGNSVR